MKAFWWQGGVHIEPESEEERKSLYAITKNLGLVDLRPEPVSGPTNSVQLDD